MAFLKLTDWQQNFKGYEITGCAVRDRNILYFSLSQSMSYDEASRLHDSEIPSRLIAIYLDEPDGENWGKQEFEGMDMPVVGACREPFPYPAGLLASRNSVGDVWSMGADGNGPMKQITLDGYCNVKRLKTLQGITYAICANRKLFKRLVSGEWERIIDENIPESKNIDELMMAGFMDLDSFDQTDMYAVGGQGDVWHYDGVQWLQKDFPSNVQLATVTCAPDGHVYISGEGGSLWQGRGDSWRQIYKGHSSVMWNDSLWFQDQLWFSSDYQLRVWDGESIQQVIMGDQEPVPIWGNMDAFDGILIVASTSEVFAYDGDDWKVIVSGYLEIYGEEEQ